MTKLWPMENNQDNIFRKLFAAAEIAKFTPEEARAYEDSLKVYRDLKNSIDTAREEGREETLAQTALKMLADDLSIETVARYTGLTPEQIKSLRHVGNRVKETAHAYKTSRKSKAAPKKILKNKRIT